MKIRRMVRMPESTDERVRLILCNESLSEGEKRPVFEEQMVKLRAMLEKERPGWQEEIPKHWFVHEHRDPCGDVSVAQHGDIE